jgi:hypothetical protein
MTPTATGFVETIFAPVTVIIFEAFEAIVAFHFCT